jgi:DNA-binding MarR family transcriptional regulator
LPKLTTPSYRLLAAFRYEMRKFLAFSEQAARDAGIEPQQHQLLLALRGLPEGVLPTIGAVAERLCVQHHTAVASVDKLEARALLTRQRALGDRRQVLLRLTPEGNALLERLSTLHRNQLSNVGPAMVAALQSLIGKGEARRVTVRASRPGLVKQKKAAKKRPARSPRLGS